MPDIEIYHAMAGSGKTTKLISLVMDEVKHGTPLSRIAFVSFTKAAANIAAQRALCSFSSARKKDIQHFRTIHSMCFQAVGVHRNQMMDTAKYRALGQIGNFSFVAPRQGLDFTEGMDWSRFKDSQLILLEQLYRVNTNYATNVLSYTSKVAYSSLVNYMKLYRKFKQTNNYTDFTDLLEIYLKSQMSQDVDVAFIDEAQDLTPLQWRVVFQAFRNTRTIYITGDVNQCIYRFTGGEAYILAKMRGNLHYLENSYRVPSNIMDAARKILSHIHDKVEMDWIPMRQGGIVAFLMSVDEIPEVQPGKTMMLLARNRAFLKTYVNWCKEHSYPYYQGDYDSPIFTATDQLEFREGRTDSWNEEKLAFANDCNAAGRFFDEPQILISTIHGVKGDEADIVVLMTDLQPETYKSLSWDTDSEHRCFFVAETRAREALYIMEPQTKLYYRGAF